MIGAEDKLKKGFEDAILDSANNSKPLYPNGDSSSNKVSLLNRSETV